MLDIRHILLCGMAISFATAPVPALQRDQLTEREARQCLGYTDEMNLLQRTIPSSVRRHERMVRQINGMPDGPSRRQLIRSADNLFDSIKEEEREHDRYVRRYEENCLKSISYSVYKKVCDDRRTLEQKNFCTIPDLRDLADMLREERGWK